VAQRRKRKGNAYVYGASGVRQLLASKVQQADNCATDVAELIVGHSAKPPLQACKRNGLNLLKVENSRLQEP
jgi:hypothetical protein